MTVEANKGAHIKLPVTKEWGAGVYVMTTVYTPRDAAKTPKPRRAVGVAHVAVDVTQRTFKLDIAAPQVQRPNGKMTVNITASGPNDNGYVQLAAVDEGILVLPAKPRLRSKFFHPANRAVRPPSTRQLAPVTNDASSDSKKDTTLSTSSTRTKRFIGIFFAASVLM
jgi:uncharacterized protein YfaS (alpha-2-macroglobulin family)